ncbi:MULTISPECIES: DNA-processing protein DprA [unclassified Clostridium]|uniref:DNA-processing protein DprA n=1 Tax=Clostridium TaxID=1485 RepID=UPI001C8BBC1D|nr:MULTISPECIES: DNA-processing protein DprA [unclassified Clostridium]MBX9135899.1 DNA-protecting protein DprA [Clostridium sp. K12(2020)]MBX9142629.1 DNA-protecting protein DprA [Clostridium sp. K13]MDU2290606.1 DNA-processing protein DprA [Clostridium celatum]
MDKYKTWLITLGLSDYAKIKLIEKYNNEENIYNNIDNIIKEKLLHKNFLTKIKNNNKEKEEKLEEYLFKNNIKYVTYSSSLYPDRLKNIDNPPYVIFYKGDITLLNYNMVAIVGSRKNTNYGEQVTKFIVSELYNISYGVVSGVAAGIDSIAHREILFRGGKTIGVLGCGIDVVYPRFNKNLYDRISEHGLLISEFLPGTKPLSYNFPQRNRIISALSNGVIVIEASNKSGSLITVDYALSQSKDVMVVPGPIFNETSKGCNLLIYQGARPFLGKKDLYEFLNVIKKDDKNNAKNSIKKCLLDVIGKEPIHIDKIIGSLNIDRIALFELLFEMQNENEIICLPGNYYVKIS